MKKLIFFFTLFYSLSGISQLPADYNTYDRQFIENYVDQLRQEWDVVIDPIERMPVQPTSYSLATGNWGADWLGTNRYHQEISTRAKRKVVVFIFDTAPRFTHPYLQKASWPEQDITYTGESSTEDVQGHGTHVAGIIGAVSDRYELGVARMLTEKGMLRLVARKVLNDSGSGAFSWIQKATEETNDQVEALQRDGWFVIYNYSLGGGTQLQGGLDRALKKARDLGVFVCAASGNSYGYGVEFPANSDGAHAVASIDSDGQRSNFSTYGEEVFVAKPGRNILSTWTGGALAEISGTSMATPGLAAMVAITASIYPDMTAADIEQALIETATDIDPEGRDNDTGHGYNFAAQILNYQPDQPNEPDQPDEPVEEITSRMRQTIRAVLPGPFDVVYQPGQGVFKPITVRNIIIDLRTKQTSEDALNRLQPYVTDFFTNRAMTLTNKEDALRAGHWVGRFLEIYLKKEHQIKSNVVTLDIQDNNGNWGKPTIIGILDYFRASRRRTFKY